jgi:hypothetical protein
MSPLESWLENGRRNDLGWRTRLNGVAGDYSSRLSRMAKRLIWPRRLKHMRYLAPGIEFQTGEDRRFTIYNGGLPLVKSKSLLDLIPNLDAPTSIVATGPTALDYPWGSLRPGERFVIAVNGAPTMLKDLGIVPDLLVVTDREFALTGAHHFEAAKNVPLAIEFLAAAALASTAPHLLTERPFAILERVNMWHGLPALDLRTLGQLNKESQMPFVFPATPEPECRIGWSHRPELGFFPGRTVVFGALQVAIGRGATDVEIIGMDLSGSGRSYSEGSSQRPTQLQAHYDAFILPSFRIMRTALAGRKVAVRNLSPVCPLPGDLFSTDSPCG